MPIYLGNTKLELNLGNVSIKEAYLGSVKVYAKATGYDSYILRIGWDNASTNDNLTFQGMTVDGSTASVSSARYYNGSWNNSSATDITHATTGDDSYNCYCNRIEFTLDVQATPSTVTWTTARWYAPTGDIYGKVIGIKDGVETELGSTTGTQSANTTYTINIS